VSSADGKTTLRFFGPLTDLVGEQAAIGDLPFPCTIARLREILEARSPQLKKQTYRIAVDEVIREETDVIGSAREIALLPPFAGG